MSALMEVMGSGQCWCGLLLAASGRGCVLPGVGAGR
jgi:hypothetical protein